MLVSPTCMLELLLCPSQGAEFCQSLNLLLIKPNALEYNAIIINKRCCLRMLHNTIMKRSSSTKTIIQQLGLNSLCGLKMLDSNVLSLWILTTNSLRKASAFSSKNYVCAWLRAWHLWSSRAIVAVYWWCHQLSWSTLRIGSDSVIPSNAVRNLGIYIDADRTMRFQVQPWGRRQDSDVKRQQGQRKATGGNSKKAIV